VIDARAAALAVAAVLAWRRAPFLVVVLASAATGALLRALGWPANGSCRPVRTRHRATSPTA